MTIKHLNFAHLTIALPGIAMLIIDHLSYPHVVDLLFAFAPVQSLVVMGDTCREWRKRVAAELYHLRGFSTGCSKNQPTWWIGEKEPDNNNNNSIQWHFYFETQRGYAAITDPRCLRFCRVVDLATLYDFEDVENKKHTLRVDTVRLPQLHPIEKTDMGSIAPFVCSRVVLDNHFGLRTEREISKLVVNHRNDDYRHHTPHWSEDCSELLTVFHLVFVVHPRGSPQRFTEFAEVDGEQTKESSVD